MASTKKIKIALLAIFSFVIVVWGFSGNVAGVRGDAVVQAEGVVAPETAATPSALGLRRRRRFFLGALSGFNIASRTDSAAS